MALALLAGAQRRALRPNEITCIHNSLPKIPPPPPLSRPRYDIFSGAVHIDLPHGALVIFHTGGSVVGVGVVILVLNNVDSEILYFKDGLIPLFCLSYDK